MGRRHPFPDSVIASLSPPNKYWFDFPSTPIGGGNPYQQCSSCGRSVPEINGDLFNHLDYCEWANAQIALLFDPLTRLDELATVADFSITCKPYGRYGKIEWSVKMGEQEEQGAADTPSEAVKRMLQLVGLLPEQG